MAEVPTPPTDETAVGWRWRRPRLTVYRPNDTRPRVLLNRYPGVVIGIAAVAFKRCLSITWKKTW